MYQLPQCISVDLCVCVSDGRQAASEQSGERGRHPVLLPAGFLRVLAKRHRRHHQRQRQRQHRRQHRRQLNFLFSTQQILYDYLFYLRAAAI